MPWIRFKRWSYLNPLAPHVAACTSGNRYLWKGDADGATLVEQQKDVDELLNPMGDRQSDYEVAWERYGVTFDARGKEVAVTGEANFTIAGTGLSPLKPVFSEAKSTAQTVGRRKK